MSCKVAGKKFISKISERFDFYFTLRDSNCFTLRNFLFPIKVISNDKYFMHFYFPSFVFIVNHIKLVCLDRSFFCEHKKIREPIKYKSPVFVIVDE